MNEELKNIPQDVINAILNPQDGSKPMLFTLPLVEFKSVFQEIQKKHPATKVDIVLNGSWAIVQFSELCNHRIRILPNNHFSRWKRFFRYRLYLEENDFEIASSVATFYGQRKYLTFIRFVREEVETSGFLWLMVFLISNILLYLIYATSNSVDFLGTVNEILIQISALFFSIFMLFTASQGLPLDNLRLFSQGSTHRFMRVDTLVAWFSIITLGLASVNKIIIESAPSINSQRTIFNLTLDIPNDIIPFTTAVGVTSLTMSLIIVVQYYFKRVEALHQTNLSKEILDKAFDAIEQDDLKL